MENPSGSEGIKKINWRQFGKHWIVVFILAIVAAFVIWGMLNASPWLKKLQNWRAARALQSQLQELYRNDKYGGKTPEETFDMFIAALEKGDVELASKYFVLEKQESWLKTLEEYKSKALLSNLTAELENNKNNWKLNNTSDETAAFTYNYVVKTPFVEELPLGNGQTQKLTHPAGEFSAEIIFNKNKFSNIWKISVL